MKTFENNNSRQAQSLDRSETSDDVAGEARDNELTLRLQRQLAMEHRRLVTQSRHGGAMGYLECGGQADHYHSLWRPG